jgi:hypothetical protein
LYSWSSSWTVFVEIGSSRRIFSSVATYAAVVWFFETILNVRQSLPIFVHCSSSLMLSSHEWYADLTLETVALDTPNKVTDFCQRYSS